MRIEHNRFLYLSIGGGPFKRWKADRRTVREGTVGSSGNNDVPIFSDCQTVPIVRDIRENYLGIAILVD